MIAPGTRFKVARIPLSRIVVTEHQMRYPERVTAYFHRLLAHPTDDLDLVRLAPFAPDAAAPDGGSKAQDAASLYQILDGHHRFVAYLLAGRRDLVALLYSEPGWPGHETRTAGDGWMSA